VYARTERLGEAVAGHVTANTLISMVVLARSQWQLW